MAVAVQIGTYEELQKIIADSDKEYDRERIEQAYLLAAEKHREQRRSSGEPYIIHPLSVAAILVGLGMDSESVMAGLLHDVVEDTDCALDEIAKKFGREVAHQAGKDSFFFQRRAAGGKPAKNAHGHGGGYPGHYHQICRPHA